MPIPSKPPVDRFSHPRSTSVAATELRPVEIVRCRIVNVNVRDFTVDARMEAPPYSLKLDIPWMSPYVNVSQGEGVSVMPEVGSICYVCTPSEDGKFDFVLGWVMPDENGAYRGGRELLNPGDISLSTRDKNFVILRRGGIVQVGATPVCQRVYIPIRNVIQDYAENYEMHTPAGDLTWEVMRKDEDGGGHQRCLFTVAAKEYSDDPNGKPVALLKIGSHGDGDNTILTLQTLDKGGGNERIKLSWDKDGNVTWAMEKDFSQTLRKGNFSLDVQDGSASFSTKKSMNLRSQDALSLKSSKNLSVATDDNLNLDAAKKTKITGGTGIDLDTALFAVLRNSPAFIAWVSAVSATLSTPIPTGPAAGAVAANPALATMIPTDHFNPKVKA